jgi:hypothetical protein
MQIYKTLIRPVVTYGSETWTLKKSDGNLLGNFRKENTAKDLWADPRGGYVEN